MKTLVSKQSKLMIQQMLTDEKVAAKVFENLRDKEKYKICTIEDNGVVVLGKTSWRLWNKLLNCQDELPFESFALKVWDSLVDSSEGLNKEAILKGLSLEIIKHSVREYEYDYVVNRLYDAWRHVAQNSAGYQQNTALEGTQVSDQGGKVVEVVRKDEPHNIIINVSGNKKVIPLIDSVGDELNVGLEFGLIGARRIH